MAGTPTLTPPVIDTLLGTDTVVNQNTYSFLQELTYDITTHTATTSTQIDFTAGKFFTITDSPAGTVGSITSSGSFNDYEGNGELCGVSDDLKNYLNSQFAGGYVCAFVGHAGTGNVSDPIVISVFDNDTGNTHYYSLSDTPALVADNTVVLNDSLHYSGVIYCFEKNTLIATPSGEQVVSSLVIGDEVLTLDGQARKIKWIGRQTINSYFAKLHGNLPIKITAGALGYNLPAKDLFVSPHHAILIDGVLVHALALTNEKSITQVSFWPGDVEYFHIETENHELIIANGAPAETFIDNVSRKEFDNWAEYDDLYPNAQPMIELNIPRVKFARQLPKAISAKLNEIADSLYGLNNRIAA